jgi:hypothetical protein
MTLEDQRAPQQDFFLVILRNKKKKDPVAVMYKPERRAERIERMEMDLSRSDRN